MRKDLLNQVCAVLDVEDLRYSRDQEGVKLGFTGTVGYIVRFSTNDDCLGMWAESKGVFAPGDRPRLLEVINSVARELHGPQTYVVDSDDAELRVRAERRAWLSGSATKVVGLSVLSFISEVQSTFRRVTAAMHASQEAERGMAEIEEFLNGEA